MTPSGPWYTPVCKRSDTFRFKTALVAVSLVVIVLIGLGYTIGLSKSVLTPSKLLEYIGLIINSSKQAFEISDRKVNSFAALREEILSRKKTIDVKTLQRLQGKCVSFSLAVPVAKLYIRAMSAAIALASSADQVELTDCVREEIAHWRFLDQWTDCLSWRKERHVLLTLSTDASGSGWGCVVHSPNGDQSFGDYWKGEKAKHIGRKC